MGALLPLIVNNALNVLGAVVILLIGLWLSSKADRLVVTMLSRAPHFDAMLKSFFGSLARYLVLTVTVLAVLSQFGIQTTSLIAVFGAAGLAIGLALQGTLSNLAAGVMLLLFRSFSVGDEIDAAGQRGIVFELSLFTTILIAVDGTRLIVPNGKVWGDLIRNRTIDDRRRLLVSFKVINEEGIDAYAQAAIEVATGTPAILADPSPTVAVTQIDADGAILEL